MRLLNEHNKLMVNGGSVANRMVYLKYKNPEKWTRISIKRKTTQELRDSLRGNCPK
jgi:hypothetical protein